MPHLPFGGAMATLTFTSGAASSAGDNTLVAAPGAGLRICPVMIIAQNNTTTADTLILYDGANTDTRKIMTVLAQAQGDGITVNCNFNGDDGETYQIKLTANKALVLNKAQAVATNYSVWYYTESV